MANQDIKSEIKKSGLKFWEVAESLNITDGTFSRKLRKELSEENKKNIRGIITTLEAEKTHENS